MRGGGAKKRRKKEDEKTSPHLEYSRRRSSLVSSVPIELSVMLSARRSASNASRSPIISAVAPPSEAQ